MWGLKSVKVQNNEILKKMLLLNCETSQKKSKQLKPKIKYLALKWWNYTNCEITHMWNYKLLNYNNIHYELENKN